MSARPAKTLSGAPVTDVCPSMRAAEHDLRRALTVEDTAPDAATPSLGQRIAFALGLRDFA